MHGRQSERRQAHRDVLSARGTRRSVAHPLAGMNDDGLPRSDRVNRLARLNLQFAF